MAHLTGIFRLGRDAELRTTTGGTQILSLALAYSYGRKGDDGRRPGQWVDASLFGPRAASLADYLQKGSQIYATLSDVHVRTYQKNDGSTGTSLSGVIQDLEFCGGGQSAPRQEVRQEAPRTSAPADDFDDQIPF